MTKIVLREHKTFIIHVSSLEQVASRMYDDQNEFNKSAFEVTEMTR